MMNITINIQAPELAHALETLAIAIGCTVDKIGLGEAIKDAVDQGPPKTTNKADKAIEESKANEEVKETQEPEAESEPNNEVTITIERVREAFMAKNSKANTAKLKAILKKYNVSKVTDLTEESFADVLKELEAI